MIRRILAHALVGILATFALLAVTPVTAMADDGDKAPSARSYTVRDTSFEHEDRLLNRADEIGKIGEEDITYSFVLADTPAGTPESFDVRAMNYVNASLPASDSDVTSGHPTPGVVVFYIDKTTGEVGVYDGKGLPNSDTQKIKSAMRDALTDDPNAYAKAFEVGMGEHFKILAPHESDNSFAVGLISTLTILLILGVVYAVVIYNRRSSTALGSEKPSETIQEP